MREPQKEIGVSIGVAAIVMMVMLSMMYIGKVDQLERKIGDLSDRLINSTETASNDDYFDLGTVQIRPMDPDPESGLNRFSVNAFKMDHTGLRLPLISGKVSVISQKMETIGKAQGLTMCAFEIDLKDSKWVMINQNYDCISHITGDGQGAFIVTEKSKEKSNAIATVSMDAKWMVKENKDD